MRLSKIIYNPDFSKTMRNEYVNDILPTWIQYFENLAPGRTSNTTELHFASERTTWLDFLVYDLLEVNINFVNITKASDEENTDFLVKFPKLKEFYEDFGKRPRLSKYLNSDSRLPYTIPRDPK